MARQYDFTKGNISKQLILFSWPILLANLLQTSYQVVDSLWIGNLLGAKSLGAVAISGAIIFTLLSFIIGLNNAALTILSQQKGRKNETGLKRYLNAFVVILIFLSIVISIVGFFFAEQLLYLLQTPDDILELAKGYLQINFIGVLFLFGYNFISTVLRAMGDSKSPLRFIFIAVILNFVLDPLFIAVVKLGVNGAAYATILSQGIAFLYGLIYVLRYRLAPFQLPKIPAAHEVKLILQLGIPAGLQMSVISAGSAAIMGVVATFGSTVVGGYGAAQRLDSLLMIPAQALGTSVSSMAGQNIGVRNWRRVGQVTKYGLYYNFAFMGMIGVIILLFAPFFIKLFIQDPEAVQFATTYLRIMAFCFPFLGINFILNGVVRASGAMYQVLILNIISFWVLRYPLTYVFSYQFGEIGIAIGMGTSFILSSLLAILYYRYGKWREKEILT